MILFIYGENSYLSYKKLAELKDRFIEKNGDINVHIIESETVTSLSVFKQYYQTQPLFGTKSFLVFKDMLNGKLGAPLLKEIVEALKKNESDNVIVFFETNDVPDKRVSLYKFLSTQKYAQECKMLIPYQCEQWVKKTAQEMKLSLTKDALLELSRATNDMWQLENELRKMKLFVSGTDRSITQEDVKQLVSTSIESNIFKMIDYIGQKKVKKAVNELENLIDAGENEIKILSMITYQFRNLVQARDILNQGKSTADLQSKAKLAPFVAGKSMKQADNFSLTELKKIYKELLETDYAIKTGAKEPRLALDRLVVGICTL